MITLNHSDKNLLIPCFFNANSCLTKKKAISLQCQFELKTLAKGAKS